MSKMSKIKKINNVHENDNELISLDLHGYERKEIIGKVEFALDKVKNGNLDQILIISGKGKKSLKNYVEEILDFNNLEYEMTNNGGAFLVKRKNSIKYSNFKTSQKLNINELYEIYNTLDENEQDDLLNNL
ncbi:hypothetical protein MM26B8_02050 [Mycoplasmopsis meleagridis]|uniref:Smr domain-containing protein n=2 Tax=Mycoplasmopsis meleagridis TaxID=29561 RepID=A0A0F5H100_9BACT|nr:hypothetical protein MMELEA_04410 [Mycoplasmopsis meleagridis ATCC 25294]OAD18568.1 hypothetical protein MM26B8_02050 [Mycoplasmopsis meleagridis]